MHTRRLVLAVLGTATVLSGCQMFQKTPPKVDMEVAMARMMELGQPCEHHEHLELFEGQWKVKLTMWQEPGAEPQLMEGTADLTMIMGGRFLRQSYSSEFMGMPFEGEGTLGYDTASARYFSVWMDNMGTFMIPQIHGQCSEGGKVISLHGSWYNPIIEREQTDRQIMSMQDPDHFTFVMYQSWPGQNEYKSMVIEYTRA